MPCPDDNSLNRYVDGRAGEAEKAELESHFEECSLCKELVRDFFARPMADPGESESIRHADDIAVLAARLADDLDPMAPGKKIGRYIVLELVGEGGMSEVYAAYDPELDRKVAIKLLRPFAFSDDNAAEARGRLLREAQAMAKLSHPNCVAVYDVESHGEQIAIAMEFINGRTLKTWLREEKRSLQAILQVFIQAGTGLAAAHQAGFIHRDFKPHNVMISNEGRVCVTDFGLVRPLHGNDVNAGCVSVTGDQSPELATLTRTGAVMGTPAYMAPEQLVGEDIDARGDQFSFCVALWEALFGELPFFGKSFEELRDRKISGQVRTPPKDRQVPSWLRNVVLKGLAKQPADRFGSMKELLAALAHAPGKRLRTRLVTAGVACVVALAAGVTVYGIVGRGVRCEVPPDEFAGVWDSTVRQQVRSAFHASEVPHAQDVFTRFERNLDTYISAWTSAFLESCRDTHERQFYSQDVLSLRISCLRNRRDVVRALTSNLSHDVDRSVIGRAVETALQLPLLSRCLAIDSPEDSTERPRGQAGTQALPRDLANVEILDDLGKYADGLRAAQRILLRGKQLSHMPTIAAGLFWVGRHQEGMGDYKNSEESLRNAARIAAYVGDTQLYARASLDLAWTIGVRHGRVDEASAMFSFLNEEAFAAALDEPVLLTHYLQVVGLLRVAKGDYAGACGHLTKALSIQEDILGPEHPALVKTLHNLGYIYTEQNKLDEAYTYYQRALSLAEKVLGPEHFLVGHELVSLGGILVKQGEFDRARPLLQRGLAIEERELGPSHPFLPEVLSDLGEVSLNDRDYDQARGHFQRALVIALNGTDAKSTEAGRAYAGLARTSIAEGRLSDARTHFEHAVEVLRMTPHEQRSLAEAQFGLARTLVFFRSDLDRALSLAKHAREYFAGKGDPIARAKLAEIERWSHVAGGRRKPID